MGWAIFDRVSFVASNSMLKCVLPTEVNAQNRATIHKTQKQLSYQLVFHGNLSLIFACGTR